ncbi:unnamed protein product [Amaranthus hypochondriacus]
MNRLKPQFVTFFSSSSSTGQCKDTDQKSKHGNDRWKEDKSEPLIKLGLGIGGSSFCNTRSSEHTRKDNSFNRTLMVDNKEEEDDHHDVYDHDDDQLVEKEGCRKCSVVRFTEEQMEELNRQLLIFKYLVWGIPVPFQLLIQFWTHFSYSSLPQHTQSSPILQALNGRSFHYQHAMETDLQPGRCRRTDGKKWRCQQVVIPNEKYCEKHMHRGSKRSRKLVETSPNAGTLNGINPNGNSNSGSSKAQFLVNVDQNGSSMVMMRAPSLNNTTANSDRNKNQHNETKSSIVTSPRSSVTNPASGFEFSPKSVLPNGMICARIETCKNSTESEPRCKRTDGKKWQCKKGAVPS